MFKKMQNDPTWSPSQPKYPRAQCEPASRTSPSEAAGWPLTAGPAHSGYCYKWSWCSAEKGHFKSQTNENFNLRSRNHTNKQSVTIPWLQNKPFCRWLKSHPWGFSGAKAPGPPGTEGYLETEDRGVNLGTDYTIFNRGWITDFTTMSDGRLQTT